MSGSDDLNKRIQRAKKQIEQEAQQNHMSLDDYEVLPPDEKFVPYATIFKLRRVPQEMGGPTEEQYVDCIVCGHSYPLKDLIEGELNEDECPNCGTWAMQYWKDKPHRSVKQ